MKKKIKLQYEFRSIGIERGQNTRTSDPEGISRYLEESTPSKCPWHAGLLSNTSYMYLKKYEPSMYKYLLKLLKIRTSTNSGRDIEENTNNLDTQDVTSILSQSNTTAKTCSGILNVLNDSILVKAPCDIIITINDEGSWSYVTPSGSDYISLTEDHPPVQFTSPNKKNDLFKNKRVIKFIFPITLRAKEPYIHLDPQYHKATPLTVLSGAIVTPNAPLNLISIFDIPPKGGSADIIIKKGDVLAYLWASKPLKLKKYAHKERDEYMQPDSFIAWAKRKL